MNWFRGSIDEGINAAKKGNNIIVIYIEGYDNHSDIMSSVLHKKEVLSVLQSKNYINLKIIHGSDEYRQFIKIYKFVPTPSLIFIATNGLPLGIVHNVSGDSEATLQNKILKIIQDQKLENVLDKLSTDTLEAAHGIDKNNDKECFNSFQTENILLESKSIENENILAINDNVVEEPNHSVSSPCYDTGHQGNNVCQRNTKRNTEEQEAENIVNLITYDKNPPSNKQVETDKDNESFSGIQETITTELDKQTIIDNLVEDNENMSKQHVTSEVNQTAGGTGKSGCYGIVCTGKDYTKTGAGNENTSRFESTESSEFANDQSAVNDSENIVHPSNSQQKINEEELEKSTLSYDNSKNTTSSEQQDAAKDNKVLTDVQQIKIRNEMDRQRILNDFAHDREEVLARQRETAQANNDINTDTSLEASDSQTENQTRIQFRLPNGSVSTKTFDVDVELHNLRTHVAQHLLKNSRNFQLAMTYPRHVFTVEEENKSLADLQLVPNAVILVLQPPHYQAPVYIYTRLSNTFWYIASPVVSLFNYVSQALYWPSQSRQMFAATSVFAFSNSPDVRLTSTRNRQLIGEGDQSSGNVRTVTNLDSIDENDDKNNVWNGNSTQQTQ